MRFELPKSYSNKRSEQRSGSGDSRTEVDVLASGRLLGHGHQPKRMAWHYEALSGNLGVKCHGTMERERGERMACNDEALSENVGGACMTVARPHANDLYVG